MLTFYHQSEFSCSDSAGHFDQVYIDFFYKHINQETSRYLKFQVVVRILVITSQTFYPCLSFRAIFVASPFKFDWALSSFLLVFYGIKCNCLQQ